MKNQEFYEFDFCNKRKLMNQIPKEISIIENLYHWTDNEKRIKDYEYLKEKQRFSNLRRKQIRQYNKDIKKTIEQEEKNNSKFLKNQFFLKNLF